MIDTAVYVSPWITDRIGADALFKHRFQPDDWQEETREFLMEQLCAEHWFEEVWHLESR